MTAISARGADLLKNNYDYHDVRMDEIDMPPPARGCLPIREAGVDGIHLTS